MDSFFLLLPSFCFQIVSLCRTSWQSRHRRRRRPNRLFRFLREAGAAIFQNRRQLSRENVFAKENSENRNWDKKTFFVFSFNSIAKIDIKARLLGMIFLLPSSNKITLWMDEQRRGLKHCFKVNLHFSLRRFKSQKQKKVFEKILSQKTLACLPSWI